MRRSIVAVFVGLVLSVPLLQAQRGGTGGQGGFGGGHGGFGGGHAHPAVSGKGSGWGITGGRGFRRNRFNNVWGNGFWPGYYDGYGVDWDLPYWDYVNFPPNDVPYDQEGPGQGYAENQSSRPMVVVRDRQPATPVQSPKLVEISLPNDSAAVKPLPPALFVLTNGEKLESRRYVLSANSLQVDINRKQRTIPISELNVDATIAANQQRGIDLSFPQDRNSLFLGF